MTDLLENGSGFWAMRLAPPLCRPCGPSLFHVSALRAAVAIAGRA